MERAGRLIAKLRIKGQQSLVSPEELVRAAWEPAVGKAIARHTLVRSCREGVLVVEVGDAIWQSQLATLAGQVRDRLRELTGQPLVTRIDFRVLPRRRAPAVAVAAAPGDGDEAAAIADPVLRRLYLAARRKALA